MEIESLLSEPGYNFDTHVNATMQDSSSTADDAFDRNPDFRIMISSKISSRQDNK